MKTLLRVSALALAIFSIPVRADLLKTVQAGATDQTVTIRIIDATDGTPETGVAFNTSGIDLEYWRHGANSATDITEATQTVNGAHADGGFVHIGHGVYRLDLPDAAVAAGATAVEVFGTVTGMIVIGGTVDLSPPANVVSFGGTAGTFSAGRPEVNTTHAAGTAWGSGAITAGSIASDAITAAKIAANAIDAATFAADVDAEILSYIVDDATRIDASELNTDIDSLTFTVAGDVDVNLQTIAGAAVSTSTAQLGVNVVNAGGTAWGSGAITAAAIANGAIDEATYAADTAPRFGVLTSGTAQAGSTGTTLVLAGSTDFTSDNRITGATCALTGGTGAGASLTVQSYVNSTDTATMGGTWPTTPDNTTTYTCYRTAPSSGGSGLNAAEVRAAVGLASANLDMQLSTIDTVVDSILVDTGTTLDDLVDDIESRLGTPSNLGGGATIAANLSDIEAQTDDIGAAGAGLTAADDAVMTRLGTPAGASVSADIAAVESGISWNSAWDAEVQSEVDDALVAQNLDHLFTTTYDPASKPGAADALLNELVENDAGVARFTANALEQGPAGGGGSTNVTQIEGSDATDVIDARVAAQLAAYDPPTRSELTSDTNSVLTALGDVPTNSELAAALAAADDAILAAIAALNDVSVTDIRGMVVEDQGSITLGCALASILAYTSGDIATSGANSTYEESTGAETRMTITVTSPGNRVSTITCPSY